ncbi:MAG TPA: amidase domain-containing protein [Clostridiaceae bacterium]
MFFFRGNKKKVLIFLSFLSSIILLCGYSQSKSEVVIYSDEEIKSAMEQLFQNKAKAVLTGDLEALDGIYDRNTKFGNWACEYEERKIKYLHNWGAKQGINFIDISPKIIIRKKYLKENRCSINLICSTLYKYSYEDQPDIINESRIGTYHNMTVVNREGTWVVTKEWYNDPFADSLSINSLKVDSMKQFIVSQVARDMSTILDRRKNAITYAQEFCGSASDEKNNYKYNKKYLDYNPKGGDCANFASQILFEGGKFRKNSSWNYAGEGNRAWVNADGFKGYMVNSGRASVIAYGNYEKVLKVSYKLLPGDFVGYEKKGDITHISVVTGADSKGYSLVTCHNTDRNNVPWDLGWSDKAIKFYLVRVHF